MSRRTLAIVGVAAGAALILLLYALIMRSILFEREQQDMLEAQIQPLEVALTDQQKGAQVLSIRQAELATLQAELEAAQFAFPSEVDSTKVLYYVVTAAQTNQVVLRQVQARTPITTALGASTYLVFAYDIEVEGELAAIAGFIEELELGPVETLTVDQIVVEAPSESTAAYRATLVIQVYLRR